jgi:hypothetical protein
MRERRRFLSLRSRSLVVSAIDSNGRTIWIADAHRDDGKRFVVHADEKLTAFLELESQLVVKGMDFSEKACFAPVAGMYD